jgi:hypothetical protein
LYSFCAERLERGLGFGELGSKQIDPIAKEIVPAQIRIPGLLQPLGSLALEPRHTFRSLGSLAQGIHRNLQSADSLSQLWVGFEVPASCRLKPLWRNEGARRAVIVLLTSPPPAHHQPDRRGHCYPTRISQLGVTHPSTVGLIVRTAIRPYLHAGLPAAVRSGRHHWRR